MLVCCFCEFFMIFIETIQLSYFQTKFKSSNLIFPFIKHFFVPFVLLFSSLSSFVLFCFFRFFFVFFFFLIFYLSGFYLKYINDSKETVFLTPLYHFHPLHRRLDISQVITAESSPLHIASRCTRTGNLWFPSASR